MFYLFTSPQATAICNGSAASLCSGLLGPTLNIRLPDEHFRTSPRNTASVGVLGRLSWLRDDLPRREWVWLVRHLQDLFGWFFLEVARQPVRSCAVGRLCLLGSDPAVVHVHGRCLDAVFVLATTRTGALVGAFAAACGHPIVRLDSTRHLSLLGSVEG